MFHLTTHAFFKALLFLGAGSVIHALHTQDIRQMGGLIKKMPVTGWTFFVGTLALVGIFPLSGFWSKEEILMTAWLGNFPVFVMLLATVLFTAIYMGRLFGTAFLGAPAKKTAHEPTWVMKGPLLVLAFFALASGLLPFKEFVPLAHDEGHQGSFLVTLLGLSVGTIGFLLTLYFYTFKTEWITSFSNAVRGPRELLEKKYFIDEIYNGLIHYGQDSFAHLCELFERYIVVGLYVNGTARFIRLSGDVVRKLQTGRVQFYALVFSLGATALAYGLILWKP